MTLWRGCIKAVAAEKAATGDADLQRVRVAGFRRYFTVSALLRDQASHNTRIQIIQGIADDRSIGLEDPYQTGKGRMVSI